MMEVRPGEQAVITVNTKHHITLVFESMVMEIFQKDGVVYTRIESDQKESRSEDSTVAEDDESVEVYEETQKMVETPSPVVKYCNGHFENINEKHAEAIRAGTPLVQREYVKCLLADEFYDLAGDTQLMY